MDKIYLHHIQQIQSRPPHAKKIQGRQARFLLADLSETPHTGMPLERHRHLFSICKAPSVSETLQ
ncbi:hypothetical protein PR202_gb15326 [Eleusine coracana subsp. coracana]|uniref:Uncharacterized protein n=1 Tax=Eleusine coracana subsp. coracana TaxID=191504 RepID=A0AAV5EXP4_ELECO|nr:hypothetical protein PR202_gb15326 [Eleusine coracana subsp. coracana]